jgi:hypothetical protein
MGWKLVLPVPVDPVLIFLYKFEPSDAKRYSAFQQPEDYRNLE